MNHKFTLRESLLLLLCVFVGLGILYYQVVYKGFERAIAQYDVAELETEVVVYQNQLARKKQMESYLNEHRGETLGEIAMYNNLANEISEVGRIFAGVDDLSISWGDPTLTDVTVRRNASISFSTTGYDKVTDLIRRLNRSAYRVLITDVSISAGKDEVLNNNGEIKTTIRVTFFEKVDNTTNLDGLVILNSNS